MKFKFILFYLVFSMIFSLVSAQEVGYYYTLKFKKEDIIKAKTPGFAKFIFSFRETNVLGGDGYYLLRGVAYNDKNEEIGEPFFVDKVNPIRTRKLRNFLQGTLTLTINEMPTEMEGEEDWYMIPKKYKEGQGNSTERHYVSYKLTERLAGSPLIEIELNPSPPKGVD